MESEREIERMLRTFNDIAPELISMGRVLTIRIRGRGILGDCGAISDERLADVASLGRNLTSKVGLGEIVRTFIARMFGPIKRMIKLRHLYPSSGLSFTGSLP
jgi:hypothetical protein